MADTDKRLNVVLSQEFHTELKIAAAKANVSISQFVIDAIKDKIAKEHKENK